MGLVKRGKVWWMSFTYDGRRVRRSTDTSDKRLAERILAKVHTQIVEGKFFDKSAVQEHTFSEMMDRYLRERSVLKAPKSQIRDHSSLKHLIPVFGDALLGEITPKSLAAYKNQRRLAAAAPATINKELQLVRHAFNLAMREWEWCHTNPMHRISLEPVRNQGDRWLTSEEEARLLHASSAWLRDVITFALNTGMRQGEILDLSWQEVDFCRGTLVVMKSKNGERRTIPLNNTVFELLAGLRAKSSENEGRVFKTGLGNKLKARYLGRAFMKTVQRAGISRFRFHDLRHTFATRLVHMGVDLYKVQRLLGHKSGLMTQRYAHHGPESLRDGVNALERARPVGTNLTQSSAQQEGRLCNVLK